MHIDNRLLNEEKKTGDAALRILAFKLHEITFRIPSNSLSILRDVPIFIDFDHRLSSMQYHPSRGWLKENGHDPAMQKAVHIPRAGSLMLVLKLNKQPWVILHELAHGYHDRHLGFGNHEILEAYKKAKASGRYDRSLLFTGDRVKHYSMTDHKEYFAELTKRISG